MRKSLFILALLLAACGNDGNNFQPPDGGGVVPPVQHVPEISNLKLSPSSVMFMSGDGQVAVSLELGFRDVGQDIQTLWVVMPDGTRVEFAEASGEPSGTLSEEFTLSTKAVGAFTVEAWLVDKAGDSSGHLTATFEVLSDVAATDWTIRLSGLPYFLNDVAWTGARFVAVGDDGKILTSDDGTGWVERTSGTDAGLTSVASYGADVVAVGYDATVLLSNDGGVSWALKHRGSRVLLAGVAMSPSQIVAGGMDLNTGEVFIIRSPDRGATWTGVDSWPRADHFVTGLTYASGLFVAGTYAYDNQWPSDARVMVSADGRTWNDITVKEDGDSIDAVWHADDRFIASGSDSAIFQSADGYNWTQLPTPIDRVDYRSAAWNGHRLVVAGGITWWYWWFGTPSFERPVGLSSTDGGTTWEIFNIDGYYQSNGLAWGNGRFVSVGQSTPVSGEGAIYTSE